MKEIDQNLNTHEYSYEATTDQKYQHYDVTHQYQNFKNDDAYNAFATDDVMAELEMVSDEEEDHFM